MYANPGLSDSKAHLPANSDISVLLAVSGREESYTFSIHCTDDENCEGKIIGRMKGEAIINGELIFAFDSKQKLLLVGSCVPPPKHWHGMGTAGTP